MADKPKPVFIWVLLGTLIALVLGIFVFPSGQPQGPAYLPWQVEAENGSVRVFGVTLAKTPLAELERRVEEEAAISLFRTDDGTIAIEAYFDGVTLSGIRAKLVATVEPGETVKTAMYERGVRVATLGSGTRKVTLAAEDLAAVRQMPVAGLTYLPRANLTPEMIEKRFGAPARRIGEPKGDVEHWLYPSLGLDIAVHPEEKEVFQYVPPAEFERRIVAPLEEAVQEPSSP